MPHFNDLRNNKLLLEQELREETSAINSGSAPVSKMIDKSDKNDVRDSV
jgi:hypothetical protein